jgi:hypothetical protein
MFAFPWPPDDFSPRFILLTIMSTVVRKLQHLAASAEILLPFNNGYLSVSYTLSFSIISAVSPDLMLLWSHESNPESCRFKKFEFIQLRVTQNPRKYLWQAVHISKSATEIKRQAICEALLQLQVPQIPNKCWPLFGHDNEAQHS